MPPVCFMPCESMESPAAAKTLTPARTKYFRKVKVSTFLVVMPFGFRWRHPERSRFSGGERDLARITVMLLARSLRPLEQTRAFGMIPEVQDSLLQGLRSSGLNFL